MSRVPSPSGPRPGFIRGKALPPAAEMCITSTSYGVAVSNTETNTTTTAALSACGTILGGNLGDIEATVTTTVTTASATRTPFPHVVYPKKGAEVTRIEEQLESLVNDSSDICVSSKDTFGHSFWRLPITSEDADNLKASDDVSWSRDHLYIWSIRSVANCSQVASVYEACDNEDIACFDPTVELIYQTSAEPQLSYISWPSEDGIDLDNLDSRYYFESSVDKDVDVWIIDSGATVSHPIRNVESDITEQG